MFFNGYEDYLVKMMKSASTQTQKEFYKSTLKDYSESNYTKEVRKEFDRFIKYNNEELFI